MTLFDLEQEIKTLGPLYPHMRLRAIAEQWREMEREIEARRKFCEVIIGGLTPERAKQYPGIQKAFEQMEKEIKGDD